MKITKARLRQLDAQATVARGSAQFMAQFGQEGADRQAAYADECERRYREAYAAWREAHPRKYPTN